MCDPRVLRNTTPDELSAALTGKRLRDVFRRGKWLVLETNAQACLLHFGMTGGLRWKGGESESRPYDRLRLAMEKGELVYHAQRILGGVWLVDSEAGLEDVLGELGPDAYAITAPQLSQALSSRGRRKLKASLMDQRVVAGLGNLTVDEILWRARVHPQERYEDLDAIQRRRLHRAFGTVLRPAVRAGAVPNTKRWLSSQRSLPHPRCPRCGHALDRIRIAGRGTLVCPHCQSR